MENPSGECYREKKKELYSLCVHLCVCVCLCVCAHTLMHVLRDVHFLKKYLESSHMKFLSESKVGKWSP